jgi:TolB-like protein
MALPDASVAVLPFVVMSNDGALSHLGDAFAGEITVQLARRPNLKVASRTSAFQTQAGNNATATGRSLGTSYVVEGSVQTEGNHLRLTAQLARTRDGYYVWSSTFDLTYPIDALQREETLRSVGWMLSASVDHDVALQLARSETSNDEAYNAYVKAHRLRFSTSGMGGRRTTQEQLDYVDRALELDPDFASALDLRAEFYFNRIDGVEWDVAIREARKSIDRALANNPNRVGSLSRLAPVQIYLELDYRGAEATLDRIRMIDPGNHVLNDQRATLAMRRGKVREAKEFWQRQLEVDPYNPRPHMWLGMIAFYQGDLEVAERECNAMIQLWPQSPYRIAVELWRIRVWNRRGEDAKAKAALELLWARNKHTVPEYFAYELALLGYEAEARALVDRMARHSKPDPYGIFSAFYGLKDHVRALTWLRRAIDERHGRVLDTIRIPNAWPEIQELPEFRSLLAHLVSIQRSP